MTNYPNRLSVLLLASLALVASAAAQGGSEPRVLSTQRRNAEPPPPAEPQPATPTDPQPAEPVPADPRPADPVPSGPRPADPVPSEFPYGAQPLPPLPTAPPAAEAPPSSPSSPPPAEPSGSIQVQPLDGLDPSAQGTLDEGSGGFGPNLWNGSDAAGLTDLLEQMPVATASPVMNDLARRLLLTGAAPREAAAWGSSVFDARLTKLLDAGLVTDLAELLGQAGGNADPLIRVEALLLTGQDEAACETQAEATSVDAKALQLRAFCQIVAGDTAAASLSADLAREKGATDETFFALVAHLANGEPLGAVPLKDIAPVNLALARRAKVAWTADDLAGAPPAVLAVLARDPATAADLRVTAAERAGIMGALDADTAGAIFAAAKTAGTTGPGLYRAVLAAADMAPKAKALEAAVAASDGRGLTAFYARLLARPAWETTPSSLTAAYADPVTRVLLLSGRGDRVADWMNAAPATLKDELLVRIALNAPSSGRVIAAATALAKLAESKDPAVQLRAVLYAGALEAMGFDIPAPARALLTSSPAMAAPPVGQVETAELSTAAREGRVGETLLRTLIALGRGGPAKAHPAVVIEAVAALHQIGLKAEASALALEAALARQTGGGG